MIESFLNASAQFYTSGYIYCEYVHATYRAQRLFRDLHPIIDYLAW